MRNDDLITHLFNWLGLSWETCLKLWCTQIIIVVVVIKMGSLLKFNEDDFDDVQSYTNTVYHCFRLSLELIFCIGVVYLGLHVNQA